HEYSCPYRAGDCLDRQFYIVHLHEDLARMNLNDRKDLIKKTARQHRLKTPAGMVLKNDNIF
ncbi:MAG: hypothetical protein JW920_01670, partial [Deltaproteobacteria bacterium]|nr:hypothetical protein [Deltaproteobacteria bacterium]